jgi:hypothetical protein
MNPVLLIREIYSKLLPAVRISEIKALKNICQKN